MTSPTPRDLGAPVGAENTDREIYREREGDYYADSIHVTKSGGIGFNVGGSVIVKPLREWFELIAEVKREKAKSERLEQEAAQWKMEDAGHKSSLFECYRAVTGGTGEPADWNGSRPVVECIESLREELSQLKAERDRMAEALAILEPKKPADDPKDGPCCHEQTEDGFWICTGCTCQNYGDAQNATLWADAMNRWIEWNNLTQKPGEKPMTNASEITARDAALLFRNPTHFSELIEAFEASAETDTAGKLDDALKSVARRCDLNTGEKTDG